MITKEKNKVEATLEELFDDSKYDALKMVRGAARSIFRPIQPLDFEHAYLSITPQQGAHLKQLIVDHDIKHIVEFGTSFGISTLFLAQGVMETGGHIVTTELLESKALQAIENFKKAEVDQYIDVKIGDAMKTLSTHNQKIDLLLLDGWKDLYLPLFRLLEPNFHDRTIIYVDNANMSDSRDFLQAIDSEGPYNIDYMFGNSVALITSKNKR